MIVSGNDTRKLLGVPQLTRGTGEAQAKAVFKLISDWNLVQRIQFMCFDTTASNTSNKAGTCTLLQQKFQRDLIGLASRHHMHELIEAKVLDELMGCPSGPNIKLFKLFCTAWKDTERNSHESGMNDECIVKEVEQVKKELKQFFHSQLNAFHPMDDYKELLQLALLFLGNESLANIHTNSPGA